MQGKQIPITTIDSRPINFVKKIIASTGEIDLSPEELVMVKQAATIYSAAGVYAQIVELVDPEK